MLIRVGRVAAAGRRGAGAVAESSRLILISKAERERQGLARDFCNFKAHTQ